MGQCRFHGAPAGDRLQDGVDHGAADLHRACCAGSVNQTMSTHAACRRSSGPGSMQSSPPATTTPGRPPWGTDAAPNGKGAPPRTVGRTLVEWIIMAVRCSVKCTGTSYQGGGFEGMA